MARVVVIGGGFAGLAAATRLVEAGQQVTLLERRGFLGGRAYSFKDATTGDVVDNGQHLFMGCYRETLDFLRRIGASHKLRLQPVPKVDFIDAGQRRSQFRCPGAPAPLHLLLGLWRLGTLGVGDKFHMMAVGRALRNLENGSTARLNELSVTEWLGSLRQSRRAQANFWNPIAIATLNQDPQKASADLFVRVLQEAFMGDRAGGAIGISTVGLSDLYAHDAELFIRQRGSSVRLNAAVSHILLRDQKILGVRLSNGEILDGDVFIAAVPPDALTKLLPTAFLASEEGFRNLTRLKASPIVSINLWFDRPVTDLEFAGLLGSRVHWLFNKDRILSIHRRATMQIALVISAATEAVLKPKGELIDLALAECHRLLPGARGASLLHAVVVKEREATISHEVGTGRYRLGTRTSVPNLYLAGDWTDTGLPATIEGAVRSGHRAAGMTLGGK